MGSPAPIFIGKFSNKLKISLLRRLDRRGVRYFVRQRSRILAYTVLRKEIYITVVRNHVRSVNFWFHEDALNPRTVIEFRKLQGELAAVMPV